MGKEKKMTNREIEKNIQSAFSKIQPDQLNAILSDCGRKESRMIFVEEKKQYNWMPRLAMAMTAFVLVFGLVFGVSAMNRVNDVVAATISLDVNPSIEIKINKQEKVLDVFALNDDAKKIVGDMDFKGSDLKVTVNALIGSLVRNGYINELTNSILISVDDADETQAKSIEEKLMAEISNLIDKGSVLSQKIDIDDTVRNISEQYGITLGKAQLVKQLADKSTIYTYEDLAGLTINELNLLSKDLENSTIQRNGQPSDKAYIGTDKAKDIALNDVGVKEANVVMEKAELDFENKTMVYEIEFDYNGVEYEYVIDATNGTILFVYKEHERVYNNTNTSTAPATTVQPSNTNTATNTSSVSDQRAKEIALANAGLKESEITGFRYEKEYDDGVVKYEMKFYVGNVEYEYEINANTGTIIKAEKEIDDDYRPAASAPSSNSSYTPNTTGSDYKVENGTVYEYDDGKWEPEYDKKEENGVVYEYDDGKWEADSKTEGNVTYDYDDDTGTWEPDEKVENGVKYEYDDDTGSWEVDNDDDDD